MQRGSHPFFLCELLSGKHLIALKIFLNGLVHDLLGQCPVVVRIGLQPVAGKLLVKGRLTVTRLITVCRPETGAVRSQHLIADGDVSILIQTKLKFGIGNDDTFAQCVLGAFFIKSNGIILQLLSILFSFARIVLFQMINALLIGNILIVISDLRFRGGSVDRLRQFVGFFQTFRQTDPADGSVLLVAGPAASCNVSRERYIPEEAFPVSGTSCCCRQISPAGRIPACP